MFMIRVTGCRCHSLLLILALLSFGAAAHGESDLLRFTLKPVSAGIRFSVYPDLDKHEMVFKSEPLGLGADTVGGAFVLGSESGDLIGFAWDKSHAVLYIDTNRNLDLTDDEPVESEGDRLYGILRLAGMCDSQRTAEGDSPHESPDL
jgi:hypothetical protein